MFGSHYGQYHQANPYRMGTAVHTAPIPQPQINQAPQLSQVSHPPPMVPQQIPPPNIDLINNQPLRTIDLVSQQMIKLQYQAHQPPPNYAHHPPDQPPPNYTHPPPDFPLPIPVNVEQHISRPVLSQIPAPAAPTPLVAQNINQCSTPDFTSANTSFTGIGTNFETPQRQPLKPSEFSANNTSFTGIGVSFDPHQTAQALEPVQKEQIQPRTRNFCSVCNFDLCDDERYESHVNGMLHKQKIAEREGRKPIICVKKDDVQPKAIKDLKDKYPDQYCEVRISRCINE
jgi:hypothetical protein